MQTLYKYMPLSTLLKFMDDPCLRVTPSYCQNDPFEFGYSQNDIYKLKSVNSNEDIGHALRDFSNLHGIISLSESKDEVLMWSHYSTNHTGVVVELLIDRSNPQSLFINSTDLHAEAFEHSDFLFNSVNYSPERGYKTFSTITDIDFVKKHYYFTKAEQWKYEQEHRFITPLTWINRIVFNDKGYEVASDILEHYLQGIICLNPNDVKENKRYELDSCYLTMILSNDAKLIAKLWDKSEANDIMFFIRLNQRYIGNIYLGCKSDTNELIDALKGEHDAPFSINTKYYDLFTGKGKKVFKGVIDNNLYKLNFQEVLFNLYI